MPISSARYAFHLLVTDGFHTLSTFPFDSTQHVENSLPSVIQTPVFPISASNERNGQLLHAIANSSGGILVEIKPTDSIKTLAKQIATPLDSRIKFNAATVTDAQIELSALI